MNARVNPPCGIYATANKLEAAVEEQERQKKAIERMEKAQRQARRRGEWGKRGVR